MSKKTTKVGAVVQWSTISEWLSTELPNVMPWLLEHDSFRELRFKSRDDGTVIAVLKGYGADGGEIVCFGVGYDVVLAIMQLDRTVAGGYWREDKPWSPPS